MGILGGSATAKSTKVPALYGLSTNYLKKVLRGVQPLNIPLATMTDLLGSTVRQEGVAAAKRLLSRAKRRKRMLLTHDFSPESFNRLATELAAEDLLQEAIGVYQLSIAELPLPDTHYALGTIHERSGKPEAAKEAYRAALQLWPEHEAAQTALQKLE